MFYVGCSHHVSHLLIYYRVWRVVGGRGFATHFSISTCFFRWSTCCHVCFVEESFTQKIAEVTSCPTFFQYAKRLMALGPMSLIIQACHVLHIPFSAICTWFWLGIERICKLRSYILCHIWVTTNQQTAMVLIHLRIIIKLVLIFSYFAANQN